MCWTPTRETRSESPAEVLQARMPRVTHAGAIETVPLRVHARYSRDEALAAFGVPNPNSVREGVKYVEPERADMLFVTLQKTEEHFSPTTMYRDRAVSPTCSNGSRRARRRSAPRRGSGT